MDYVGDLLYHLVDEVSKMFHVRGLDRDDGVEPPVDRIHLDHSFDLCNLTKILEYFLRGPRFCHQEYVCLQFRQSVLSSRLYA